MNVRFDQISAAGLRRDLPAQIVLSSRSGQPLKGHVLRRGAEGRCGDRGDVGQSGIQHASPILAAAGRVGRSHRRLRCLACGAPTVANAALRRFGEQTGVWRAGGWRSAVCAGQLGASDLNGRVQVREGVAVGDQVVTYSEKTLTAKSSDQGGDHIAGAPR